jgi:hypothetical protein
MTVYIINIYFNNNKRGSDSQNIRKKEKFDNKKQF